MKLPTELTIGHQAYEILSRPQGWMRDTQNYGSCDAHTQTINIVTEDVSNVCITNTLVHEVLHGLFREYNLPEDHEEHVVTCLANGLCQVVRDNPEFLKVLKGLKNTAKM
jgi:hypothetical protein